MELARPGVPSTPALKPLELPDPFPPQLQPDSSGHHETDEVCAGSDGHRLHRSTERLHIQPPAQPSCLPSEDCPECLPSTAFTCRNLSSLVFLQLPLGFLKRTGKSQVKFSLVSPRESELRGTQHSWEANKIIRYHLPGFSNPISYSSAVSTAPWEWEEWVPVHLKVTVDAQCSRAQ